MVLVTTQRFSEVIEVGDPVSQARIYQAQAADELIFLDLDAWRSERDPSVDVVRVAAEEIFMPFTVGGGVRSLDHIRRLLSNGADKVSINTAAVDDPAFISAAANQFGSQCITLSIDYRIGPDGSYRVWSRGGTSPTELDPVRWAAEGEDRGAGEILLTSIERDGTRRGLDLQLTAAVTSSVGVPVITGGGCGVASDFADGFATGGADGVSAGTYFCFRDENPMQTRSQIANRGIPIRMHT
jgi:cyclase